MASRKETEFLRDFVATDAAGQQHTLEVWVDMHYSTSLSGTETARPGLLEIRTEEGLNVNALGNGDFQVVVTGLLLHSDDPKAPK